MKHAFVKTVYNKQGLAILTVNVYLVCNSLYLISKRYTESQITRSIVFFIINSVCAAFHGHKFRCMQIKKHEICELIECRRFSCHFILTMRVLILN